MKPYVKPELNFESYELSQHIAACRWDWTNQQDKYTCYATYDPNVWGTSGSSNYKLFADTNGSCTMSEDMAEMMFGYCYTTGTNQNVKLFQS